MSVWHAGDAKPSHDGDLYNNYSEGHVHILSMYVTVNGKLARSFIRFCEMKNDDNNIFLFRSALEAVVI